MPHRWCDSASLRRTQIESGLDLTFNEVFKPLFVETIASLNPQRILEIGTGTGHLSKELSQLGCEITAIEPSKGMYEVAAKVLSGTDVNLINCTSFELKESSKYDIAFSHMVAHVVDDLEKFFESISTHLNGGAHFIFSIPHPCFYNNYKKFFGSEYNYMLSMKKEVSFCITKDETNAISGVPYNHRPLSVYINSIVKVGFAIDRFEEIYPNNEIQNKYGSLWKEPRYCVFICRML